MANENTKKETTFDDYQKKAINVEKNAVVSAGAGSGKTTVLSERFLHLIQKPNGYNVDEILTLTFTKKATVEMSDRIYKVLKKNAPEQAANFYKANIKTLDSYCNSVAKIGAHLYGMSPDFTQDDASIYNQAYQKALPFILKHRDNFAIKELVNTKDYAQIANELFVNPILKNSTIAEPIDFESAFKKQISEILNKWQATVKITNDLLNQLVGVYSTFEGNAKTKFIEAIKNAVETNEIPGPVTLTEEQVINSDSHEIEEYASIVNDIAYISQAGARGDAVQPLKDVLNELRNYTGTLVSICNYVSGFNLIAGLLPLLTDFQEIVNNIKRSTGILTFKDISNMALCILRDHPDIRALEKQKYKAIMIDEFQDNNSQQRDMLFLLAEKLDRMDIGVPSVEELCPEKLFFVGDEKQSIYIFRGADVTVFNELAGNFKENNLEMTNNYRSESALIAAFNTIFGGYKYPPEEFVPGPAFSSAPSVFYNERDAESTTIPNHEAIYHKVTLPNFRLEEIQNAQKESSEKLAEIYKPRVHVALYDKNQIVPNEEFYTEEEAEAEWIANKIDELIANGQNPAEIAVLFRNYSLQPTYEKIFLKHGIPYNTETVTGLYSDGPVNDIMALLQICIYPKDTISYAQVLRSPFVNLSITETMAVIANEKRPFAEGAESVLEGKSLEIFKNMQSFFKKFSESVLTQPITHSITTLWYEMGYRFETMWNHTVEMYGKLYDLMFELARSADEQNVGLSGFIDLVSAYKSESSKLDDMDIPLDQPAGVHILSIHKSKGLEFEVVFVAATHRLPKSDSNASPVFSSKEFGITINTPPCKSFANNNSQYFYGKVKDEKDEKLAAELRRITYVALTRAKKELYITNGKYKIEPNPNKYLPGGENNVRSIFNVLTPVISYYMSDSNKPYAPFDVEIIPPFPRIKTQDSENLSRQNTLTDKKKLIAELNSESPYKAAEKNGNIITKDIIQTKYTNPSKLHKADDETNPDISNRYAVAPNSVYPEISKYVFESIPADEWKLHKENPSYEPRPRFDFTDFGTIAHAYMEAAILNKKAEISNRNIVGLDNNKVKIEKIFQICEEMAEKFKNSEIGQKAIRSTEYYAEYSFRSRVGDKIIKGIIDLVFKNDDGTYTVLDYKTNQEEIPEIYYNQLACYRQAVSQMLGISDTNSIKCYLFYLRSGHEVDITANCNKVDLSKAIQEI